MTTNQQAKATAMMRFTKIKFDHVVPAHILEGLNAGYDKPISISPVIQLTVRFSENGEPYGVGFRVNGYTLGSYSDDPSSFSPGPFMHFSPEVVAYLSQAADEALAIVQPIVTLH